MATVNLYDVLGIKDDATMAEVKSAYRRLAKEYHPDMGGNRDMFELVSHAYSVLVNPKTRKEYDSLYSMSTRSDSDHFKLKAGSRQYAEMPNVGMSKDDAKVAFERNYEEANRKHGISGTDSTLNQKDTDRRLDDLIMAREQDDIEGSHEKLWDDDKFDIDAFNATYDKYGTNMTQTNTIIKSENPLEFNSSRYDLYGNTTDYGKLYDDTPAFSSDYSSFEPTTQTRARKVNISTEDKEKYKLRHKGGHDIDSKLEEQLALRERDLKLGMDDYMTDVKYGIFGKDLGVERTEQISWDVDDMRDSYNKLMDMRRT